MLIVAFEAATEAKQEKMSQLFRAFTSLYALSESYLHGADFVTLKCLAVLVETAPARPAIPRGRMQYKTKAAQFTQRQLLEHRRSKGNKLSE